MQIEPTAEQNPTPNPHAIHWGKAFGALWSLAKDNDDTSHVFRIVGALRGASDARNVARMKQSPIGRRILEERRSMLDVLADRERLRQLPDGSLGRVYLDFMDQEGLSAEGLAEAAEHDPTLSQDRDEKTFREWARDSHDLWHVLTGYGRDPLGELCLLGVLYSQIGSPGTAFISLLGLLQVPFEYPGAPSVRAVLQGFWIGRQAEWMIAQDWEALLEKPFAQVRSELAIGEPSLYQASVPLHDAARSRSAVARAQAAAQPA